MNVSSARLRWRYLHGASWWVGVVFALLGALLLVITYFVWEYEQRYKAKGVPAVAKVVGKDSKLEQVNERKGTRQEMHYYLIYTFQDAAAKDYQGRERVAKDAWDQAKMGAEVAIEYVRDDPATNRPAKDAASAAWGPVVLLVAGGLFSMIGWALAVTAFITSGHRMRMVRDGVPALGVVAELQIDESAGKVNGMPYYCLAYHFTDEEGKTRQGRSAALPRALQSKWQAGDSILILYDRTNPDRCEADIFQARADDLARLRDTSEPEG
jgi:hypothetical protein